MSATGLLALNFCDLILLITFQKSYQTESYSSEFQAKFVNNQADNLPYLTPTSDVPHHVLVAYQDLYCSGSLIRSRIVVTAASCFLGMTNSTTVMVKVGSLTMTDIGQIIEVLEVKKHEYFGRASDLDNDIALLMLKEHVKFSTYVMKIPLLDGHDMTGDRQIVNVRVCGWGSTNLDPQYTNRLICTEMEVVHSTGCRKLYKTFLRKSNFCLKYRPVSIYRLSDNGGSVVYNQHLAGLISYGADRIKPPYIALATNITYFRRWIEVNVLRFLAKYCVPLPEYEYYYSSSSESDYSYNL